MALQPVLGQRLECQVMIAHQRVVGVQRRPVYKNNIHLTLKDPRIDNPGVFCYSRTCYRERDPAVHVKNAANEGGQDDDKSGAITRMCKTPVVIKQIAEQTNGEVCR